MDPVGYPSQHQMVGMVLEDGGALAKKKGGVHTPTGRGSGGSFFTNTLLGLSTLDRFELPVHLYPERFVTADRLKTSLPD